MKSKTGSKTTKRFYYRRYDIDYLTAWQEGPLALAVALEECAAELRALVALGAEIDEDSVDTDSEAMYLRCRMTAAQAKQYGFQRSYEE